MVSGVIQLVDSRGDAGSTPAAGTYKNIVLKLIKISYINQRGESNEKTADNTTNIYR